MAELQLMILSIAANTKAAASIWSAPHTLTPGEARRALADQARRVADLGSPEAVRQMDSYPYTPPRAKPPASRPEAAP